MKENLIVSICIPVYNQIDMVKECITKILKLNSSKFEIIVNDDCSNQPIEHMIRDIKDERIKYYRNKENLGHDRNILTAFSHASAKYVFLLRTRDFIIPEGLERIINILEKEDNDIAYLTTSAYDSNFIPKLVYKNHVYNRGSEALLAHQKLYVHPSGSVYNISLLNIQEIQEYLNSVDATKRNFTVHSLIRLALCVQGNFVTCDFYSWVYSDTNEAKDVATNKGVLRESVYDTIYQIERYSTEMRWTKKTLPEEQIGKQYSYLFSFYLNATTWNNKLVYKNKNMGYHYNFATKKINCMKERKKFLKYVSQIESELKITQQQYYKEKKKILIYNLTVGALGYYVERLKAIIPFKRALKTVLYGGKINLRRSL